jgi:hypothetical protein
MQRIRNTSIDENQIYVFDMEHEQKRRLQLEKLFNRTKEQVNEENYLMEELKKIDGRKKERERKQQEVNKLLTATDDLDNYDPRRSRLSNNQKIRNSSADTFNAQRFNSNQTNRSLDRNSRKKLHGLSAASINNSRRSSFNKNTQSANQSTTNSGNNSLNNSFDVGSPLNLSGGEKDTKHSKKSLIFKAVVESAGIKFPDNKVAGVSLRSFKVINNRISNKF